MRRVHDLKLPTLSPSVNPFFRIACRIFLGLVSPSKTLAHSADDSPTPLFSCQPPPPLNLNIDQQNKAGGGKHYRRAPLPAHPPLTG